MGNMPYPCPTRPRVASRIPLPLQLPRISHAFTLHGRLRFDARLKRLTNWLFFMEGGEQVVAIGTRVNFLVSRTSLMGCRVTTMTTHFRSQNLALIPLIRRFAARSHHLPTCLPCHHYHSPCLSLLRLSSMINKNTDAQRHSTTTCSCRRNGVDFTLSDRESETVSNPPQYLTGSKALMMPRHAATNVTPVE